MSFQLSYASTLANVSAAVKQVADHCRRQTACAPGQDPAVEQVELCVAEALTNVVKHAYGGCETETFHIACEAARGQIVVEIIDRGKELPQRALEQTELRPFSGELSDLPESGFGWFIILDQMDTVSYRRESGTNFLTLTKQLIGAN